MQMFIFSSIGTKHGIIIWEQEKNKKSKLWLLIVFQPCTFMFISRSSPHLLSYLDKHKIYLKNINCYELLSYEAMRLWAMWLIVILMRWNYIHFVPFYEVDVCCLSFQKLVILGLNNDQMKGGNTGLPTWFIIIHVDISICMRCTVLYLFKGTVQR